MTDEELINDFADKVNRGVITFDKVRPGLEEMGLEESRVKEIVRRVDDEVQRVMLSGGNTSSLDRVIVLGIVLVVVGACFILASLVGLFSSSKEFLMIVAYGPLVAGLVLVVIGMRRKKKQSSNAGSQASNRKFKLRDKSNYE